MLYIKEDINIKELRKYGFKMGREWPDYKWIIRNEYMYDWYYLFPLYEDEDKETILEDYGEPLWKIEINPKQKVLYIEGVPMSTYHIDNLDMEQCFSTLYQMIIDGVVLDRPVIKEK